ncbi:hypothetical protein [Rhodospirillum centenum]|uniref:Uncharacterized protein n=1 Tax=Rhodospirillum centenum (strain ATCC 51521 / SW) TaxID=414684 RepID=B6INZ3_RHOCS|nr:hypothetical protein [Rhodospirillum centenum]ACI99413.1 conserved hypothetical protein [Rhodospirillum centenum SW]
MALRIETFSNVTGGSSTFKALGHPLAARQGHGLLRRLAEEGPVALFDPLGLAEPFAELWPLHTVELTGVYVQDVERIGLPLLGERAMPVTAIAESTARLLFVVAFDADRLVAQIRHLIPPGTKVLSLDPLKLPAEMLTDPGRYLAPLNFATNFAFFRDSGGHHTRLVTANYWSAYGAASPRLWLCLFDHTGTVLAEWTEALPEADGTVVIDSAEVRRRFGLPEFVGQLFVHVVGAAGHDVVKYALDTYGSDPHVLSCTHDANAWPADFYAGLPAPQPGERVLLWVQNSHPVPIPSGTVALNPMGRDEEAVTLRHEVPPFGSYALDVAELLPELRWPRQIEVRAGRHFVRPRYEVVREAPGRPARRRIAHPNVERTDLMPDPHLPELRGLLGKGFILPAPVFPPARFRSIALPTPMARGQQSLPLRAILYDADGTEVTHRSLGLLPRDHATALDVETLLDGHRLRAGYGHLELIYDFAVGEEADGWLHALFRYEDRESGHAAETSFGAHMFNTCLVYRGEPQSYAGRPPGLSTRLFLRTGMDAATETFCHLIYPASTPWRQRSDTSLILTRRDGSEVARRHVRIACSGSYRFQVGDTFDAAELREAGPDAHVLIRDTTCRLFGYHGLIRDGREGAFALDHMFGF